MLSRYDQNGIELVIDTETGEAYATQAGYVRMSGIEKNTMSNRLNRGFEGVHKKDLKKAEILTPGGLQGVHLIPAQMVFKWLMKDNPELAIAMGEAGATVYLYKLAGYEVKPVVQTMTPLEYAKALVAAEEAKLILQSQVDSLEKENHQLSEAVDELFDYSSIIRIAKFNGVSEKDFNWRKLKATSDVKGCEIKKVPCQRYGTKNLYHHDVWRYCYPDHRLPETTTIVIKP